jgi:phage-related protein
MLRDVCSQIYRRWNGSAFDYVKATCPYVGAASYDKLGNYVSSAGDVCGLRVSDCKLRFGANNELPYLGFPALARVRTR